MTFTKKTNYQAFTIIESVVSMAIVAAGTLAIIASLKYGDHTALRARLDARGGKEFAKQAQWIVGYPPSDFRSQLPLDISPRTYLETTKTNGGKLLIPTGDGTLLKDSSVNPLTAEVGGFKHWTEIEVEIPADPGSLDDLPPYTIRVATFWEVPGGLGEGAAGIRTNSMEMSGVRKW